MEVYKMAIQRYFETTQNRLRIIFNDRLVNRDNVPVGKPLNAYDFFMGLYPMYTGAECVDIIVGCLRFLSDDLKLKEFNGNKGIIKFNTSQAVCDMTINTSLANNPVEFKFQNYRSSMSPSISMRCGDDYIPNICGFTIRGLEIASFNMMMQLISEALATMYTESGGKKRKWKRL